MTDARAHFVWTKPVFLGSGNLPHVFTVIDEHAFVAKLFRARLRLEVFVAAEDSLFAFAEMAESHAENKCKLKMRQLCRQLFVLLVCQLFLI